MPHGVLDVYEELKSNLLKLRMILNSSEYNHLPNVSNCINLINHLITETYQQYLELKGSKVSVDPSLTSFLDAKQGFLS